MLPQKFWNYLHTIVLIIAMSGVTTFTHAHELDTDKCKNIDDEAKRLICYDLLFAVETSVPMPTNDFGNWFLRSDISKIDDSKSVALLLESSDTFSLRYDRERYVNLIAVCRENNTSAYFKFADAFMTDSNVTLRIDGEKAFTKHLRASTDNQALGLWSGGTSIGFLKSLLDADTLILRFTPHNEGSSTVTFPVKGLRNAIASLAEACNWEL